VIKTLWASVQGDPSFMRKVNGWATVIWLAAAIPICVFFSSSVPFLVFISVYAVVTGHLSAWQAARVEVVQEEDANVQDVLDKIDEVTDE
jgi:hypothetical protein